MDIPAPLFDWDEVWDTDLVSADPLGFPTYGERVAALDGAESVTTGRTACGVVIHGDFSVFGGSMGAVHGERVVRAYRRATDAGLPVVVATTSGGARMQEGMVALVQMSRTVEAARAHARAGLLQLTVHRSPTTGGVFASYGSLGDLRAAEPGATIGFAGPRVVEELLGEPLPPGSHTAESAHAAGLVDALVPRGEQAAWVEAALGLRAMPLPSPSHRVPSTAASVPASAWDAVVRARAPQRPSGIEWAAWITSSWSELRGTDPTVRAGLATVAGERVVVLATDRHAADGRITPAGFRLAQRAIALAGRVGLPVVSLVDTPGAHPGAASEAHGVAREIASTFAAFADLPTPSVAVCVGEGGSGGALALAAADRFLMQHDAVFSVIAPEGAATILGRGAEAVAATAADLRLTSADLLGLGVADAVVGPGIDAMHRAVGEALASAKVGDRARRWDAVTEHALGGGGVHA